MTEQEQITILRALFGDRFILIADMEGQGTKIITAGTCKYDVPKLLAATIEQFELGNVHSQS